MLFLVKDSVISEILIYNLGHNILELYNVLVKIQLTTSKMKPDIQYCKFGIRVALGVGERLMLCFMETNLIHAPYGPPPRRHPRGNRHCPPPTPPPPPHGPRARSEETPPTCPRPHLALPHQMKPFIHFSHSFFFFCIYYCIQRL